MDADDSRHGTVAGHSQHYRDGEPACQPCIDADRRAGRRRRKRKTVGQEFTRAVGDELHRKLTAAINAGTTYQQIAKATGVGFGSIYRAVNEGPNHRVYAKTWVKLHEFQPPNTVTAVGLTRRVRALQRLGHSAPKIAAMSGISLTRLLSIRDEEPEGAPWKRVRDGICATYNELSMEHPDTSTLAKLRGVARVRNHAERQGWAPPLAFDDTTIDDPTFKPAGWEYRPGDRAGILRDLNDRYAGIDEACRITKRSRDSLQKWCANNGLSDLYRQLAARDAKGVNGYTKEAS